MKVPCKHCGGNTNCACNHCSANSAIGVKAICKACSGKGYNVVDDNAKSCPHCGGGGSCACNSCGDGLGHQALCHACSGTGYV